MIPSLPFKKPVGRILNAKECEQLWDILNSMRIVSSETVKVKVDTQGTTLQATGQGSGGGAAGGGDGRAVWG